MNGIFNTICASFFQVLFGRTGATTRAIHNKVRGFLVRARAKLIWPWVLPPTDQLTCPLTRAGNYTTKEVFFHNPSDQTIICHLVPMVSNPEGIKLASMLPVTYKRGGNPGVGLDTPYSNETHFRILSVHESSTENPNLGPIPGYHGDLIQADTKAGVKAVVKIIFEPFKLSGWGQLVTIQVIFFTNIFRFQLWTAIVFYFRIQRIPAEDKTVQEPHIVWWSHTRVSLEPWERIPSSFSLVWALVGDWSSSHTLAFVGYQTLSMIAPVCA